MKSALLLSVLVGMALAAPPGTFWSPCTTATYPLTITDFTMPNPVTNPTFNISITGATSVPIVSGSMKLALSFDGIPFFSETDDLCKLGAPCPAPVGAIHFVLQKTFPKPPFKGTITGTVQAFDASGALLTCLKLTVTVIPPV